MKTENAVLMSQARQSLSGKWGLAIGTCLLYIVIVLGIQFFVTSIITSKSLGQVASSIVSLLIGGPFAVGLATFSLSISRGEDARLEQIFDGFKNFGKIVGTYLLMILYIFLWMLLLIIPGIIKALSYSMTFYVLADEPSIGSKEALDKSKAMMDGNKWKLVRLQLRFTGLALLSILTLGIGFFWLMPYMQVCLAAFYDDVRWVEATSEGFTDAEEVVQVQP